MHAGILHLGMNMWALYILGPQLESLLGRVRYLLIYAASLLGGGLGVVLLFSSGQGATVGASGAIFGLLGAFVAVHLAAGQNPMRSGIGQLIGLNLLITFLIPGISIGGHIGGLVAGTAVTYVIVGGRHLRDQSSGEQVARGVSVAVIGGAFLAAAIAIAQARYGVG
jgi:membrane associated rhomboid family serine protease